jgi:hypothetical protein
MKLSGRVERLNRKRPKEPKYPLIKSRARRIRFMSHHYSGPNFEFPHGDARLDLTDLYAFPKPGDAGKSILIMDVHPSLI